jgi:hypothetical protein
MCWGERLSSSVKHEVANERTLAGVRVVGASFRGAGRLGDLHHSDLGDFSDRQQFATDLSIQNHIRFLRNGFSRAIRPHTRVKGAVLGLWSRDLRFVVGDTLLLRPVVEDLLGERIGMKFACTVAHVTWRAE